MSERFDPSKYLIDLKGKDYLQVMWRLVWLREVHPDAVIATELISFTDIQAVFKATVSIPGGGSATGFGSETPNDFRDYIEKAETKSLGRALAALGFGTQFSAHEFGGEHENGRIVDSPVDAQNGSGAKFPDRASGTSRNTVRDDSDRYPAGILKKDYAAIVAIARALGLSPEQMQAMHGKESAAELTETEGADLVAKLREQEKAMKQGALVDAARADRYVN